MSCFLSYEPRRKKKDNMEVEEELLGKKKERMGAMKCKWWRI
jgi:hypothetical protein